MSFNPTIFLIIGALCAVVSVATAILMLIAEHKRIQTEQRQIDEQSRRVIQPPTSRAVTKSESSVQVKEFSGSMFQHS